MTGMASNPKEQQVNQPLSATLSDDGSLDLGRRSPIRVGGIYHVKRPAQHHGVTIKVTKVQEGTEGPLDGSTGRGTCIVFAERIAFQSRKYRKGNAPEATDWFRKREKVYSFRRVNAIETDQHRGYKIPQCYLEA